MEFFFPFRLFYVILRSDPSTPRFSANLVLVCETSELQPQPKLRFGTRPRDMADLEKKPSTSVGEPKGAPFVDGSSMSGSHNDVEKGTTVQLQRRLQSRHLQMIAIGGTIGTGLVRTSP